MFCKVPHLSGNLNSKRRVKCPKLKHLRLTGQGYFVLVLIIMMLIDKRSILQLPYCYLFSHELILQFLWLLKNLKILDSIEKFWWKSTMQNLIHLTSKVGKRCFAKIWEKAVDGVVKGESGFRPEDPLKKLTMSFSCECK